MSCSSCLILEVHTNNLDRDSIVEGSIETLISIYTLLCCDNYDIDLCLVDRNQSFDFKLPNNVLNLFNIRYTSIKNLQLSCKLPAVKTEEGLVIGGLCAVLRWTIKCLLSKTPDHPCQNFLGFRGGCLTACSENSVWTKFCEIELPQIFKKADDVVNTEESISNIPKALRKLEAHLRCPVRTHNIFNRKLHILRKMKELRITNQQDNLNNRNEDGFIAEKNKSLSDPNYNGSPSNFHLDHSYFEGIDLTLADVIAFPCVHMFIEKSSTCDYKTLPRVIKWYTTMFQNSSIRKAGSALSWNEVKFPINCDLPKSWEEPLTLSQNSFYSRDKSKSKLNCKNFDPAAAITVSMENGIYPVLEKQDFPEIDWSELPAELHPFYGDLPGKRLERKCQQLQSIVGAVLKIALPNQTIVDFCSGGGHVGLLLAHYLPSCHIILVENKEESLLRARKRARNLSLSNISFFQCNLGYFEGTFNIGVSLHACGFSTDLVIDKCIAEKAAFVCCPCCYGGIRETSEIKFPRSLKFKTVEKLTEDFPMIAHCADRTEANTAKFEQGTYCMSLIDTDRKCYAEECGYFATLTTLQPVTCSPKHNLLIGTLSS